MKRDKYTVGPMGPPYRVSVGDLDRLSSSVALSVFRLLRSGAAVFSTYILPNFADGPDF